MRELKKIIVHCTDSDNEKHDNIETIRKWHVEENGWKDIGYHYVITKDGSVHQGRELSEVGAHCTGHNMFSIGIALTGKSNFDISETCDCEHCGNLEPFAINWCDGGTWWCLDCARNMEDFEMDDEFEERLLKIQKYKAKKYYQDKINEIEKLEKIF